MWTHAALQEVTGHAGGGAGRLENLVARTGDAAASARPCIAGLQPSTGGLSSNAAAGGAQPS